MKNKYIQFLETICSLSSNLVCKLITTTLTFNIYTNLHQQLISTNSPSIVSIKSKIVGDPTLTRD